MLQPIAYIDCTNDEVGEIIRQEISLLEDVITTVKKSNLKWYGYLKRANDLSTDILQGKILDKNAVRADRGENGFTMSH